MIEYNNHDPRITLSKIKKKQGININLIIY